jgi:hypothetical protein
LKADILEFPWADIPGSRRSTSPRNLGLEFDRALSLASAAGGSRVTALQIAGSMAGFLWLM